jgi:hypothetical protein
MNNSKDKSEIFEKVTIEREINVTLTMDCPSGCGSKMYLDYLADEGKEDQFSVEWKGATCSNTECNASYTIRKEMTEIGPLKEIVGVVH